MKKHVISVALLAVLATMAVSCQKENVTDFASETIVSQTGTVYTVQYAVNGVLHTITISNDDEWDAFMQTVFALSREGYRVSIMDGNRQFNVFSPKETVVYTTTKETDATTWSKKKVSEGYQVTVVFNKETGEYICIATR